jgi:hypothetical protein
VSNPATGRAGQNAPSSPARDAGGSANAGGSAGSAGSHTAPEDASSSGSPDAGSPGSEPGTAPDSGLQSDPPPCEPQVESCNERDDDCDGRSDEQSDVACYDGTAGCAADGSGVLQCSGQCRAGVRSCSEGELGACTGQVLAAEEVCTSGGELAGDEDCDGQVDEQCECTGQAQACYSGEAGTRDVGPCSAGTQTCSDGAFGPCEGQVLPRAETCANNGEDDDCDGDPDDVPMLGNPCMAGASMGLCARGTWRCTGSSLSCETPEPAAESCDRRDEDCDGRTDEDFDLQTNASHCGMCGRACAGAQDCCAGGCVDLASSNSHCGACGMSCASGRTCCGSACRDLQADPANCGACGRACSAGQTCCGGSCVDTSAHSSHCGACGNACGAGLSCCGGTCFNLNSAQDHCGNCTTSCGLLEGCCRGGCKLLSLGC